MHQPLSLESEQEATNPAALGEAFEAGCDAQTTGTKSHFRGRVMAESAN